MNIHFSSRSVSAFSIAMFFVLAACASAFAGNWPGWRGPDGTGVTTETNLPLHWSATENVRWKTPLPDRGNSTPIVWGDRVFVTQPIESDNRCTVVCFDRTTGKQLWQSGTTFQEKTPTHQTNPYCSSSPVTDGERVIAWFGSAGIYSYDMNGKEIWHRDLGKQNHQWGYAASPVIYKDLCILNFGPGERSFLIAMDKKSGKTIWQVDVPPTDGKDRTDNFRGQLGAPSGSWSTPMIVKVDNHDELVVTLPEVMKGFDPLAGKELWSCGGLNPLIYTSPVYGEGVVIGMGGYGGSSIGVKAGGHGDVTATNRLWQNFRDKQRIGSGVISGGHIYMLTQPGIAQCIELRSGKPVWEERLQSPGRRSDSWSSAVLAGDKVYALAQGGDTFIFKASPKFEVIGVNSLDNELTNASVAVSNGDLFIRTHKNLWCIGGKSGATAAAP
jgi:outer membrane protein assembly factor BamB